MTKENNKKIKLFTNKTDISLNKDETNDKRRSIMNKFKLQKKENIKGIALIVLVVTIIVLLILAGITISTLFGKNGIITKAQLAKMKYEEAEKKEKEMLDSIFKENEKEDTETYQIKINTEALSFNKTLGTFTVIIEYLAEKNGI